MLLKTPVLLVSAARAARIRLLARGWAGRHRRRHDPRRAGPTELPRGVL